LGVVTSFGALNGYFGSAEPFASVAQKEIVLKKARKKAVGQAEDDSRYLREYCPGPLDVEAYAAALEIEYPGYGARLVFLAFGTGLRINELLALRWDSIDLLTFEVLVDWQMDRYGNWPDLRLPKYSKRRVAQLWSCYLEIAASLILDALTRDGDDNGWLFPRHRSVTKWADQGGKLAGAAAASCDWDWTFHWLRHAHATWSLESVRDGGYGLPLKSVSEWLGHSRPSTTQDMYVGRVSGDRAAAVTATARPPGRAD
jgi:integrase